MKPSQLKRIEKLYTRRISPQAIVSPELARQMSELSHETRRQIGVLVDRKGYIEYVIIGDARKIEMPDFRRVRVAQDRFRGLRCIHTHLRHEPLTQDDLTDLALLRLDMMAAIDVDERTGLPNVVRAAHLLPVQTDGEVTFDDAMPNLSTIAQQSRAAQDLHRSDETANKVHSPSEDFAFGETIDKTIDDSDLDSTLFDDSSSRVGKNESFAFLEPQHPANLDVDFVDLINSLEQEMTRNSRAARSASKGDRAILVGVTTGSLAEAEESMAEMNELALSAGLNVVDRIIQRRPQIDSRTVLGKGKLEDLLVRAMQLGVDLIVFDSELSPAQVRSIAEATDFKVIDRAQLILDIFAQRASSREGKIQVELAQLKYILPRLVAGQDSAFSRLAGGIGGRGPGETKLETDRRRVRDRINRLEKQIEELRGHRQQRRKARTRQGLPIVSIVGYTNAGKSTLLNALTNSHVHAERKMFATLDPTSRRLRLPREQEIIINDTVGFIRDLPPDLIAAFRATLEEISDSSLLIHLVDASNPRFQQQVESVERILTELDLNSIPRITVLNKIDLLDADSRRAAEREVTPDAAQDVVSVSAVDAKTLRPMIERVGEILARDLSFDETPGAPDYTQVGVA